MTSLNINESVLSNANEKNGRSKGRNTELSEKQHLEAKYGIKDVEENQNTDMRTQEEVKKSEWNDIQRSES